MIRLPFRVTLLVGLVLSLTAWNFLRLWTSLAWRETLTEFSSATALTITTIGASVWTITGFVFLWAFLREKNWLTRFLVGSAIAYSAWYWIERLVWQNPRPNWLFAVIVNLILFVFILFATKSLTREAYERKSENPKVE